MVMFERYKGPNWGPFLFANVMCEDIDSFWIHAKYDV